jgi:tRNA (guanine-N7-)-methyltransferase
MASKPPETRADAGEVSGIGGGFYGRGKVKTLSDRKKTLIGDILPRLLIARPRPGGMLDLSALFPFKPSRVVLEIGFGGGEHLVARAEESPQDGFIGIEPFINGMAKGLSAIDEKRLVNIRLYDRDAAEMLPAIPDGSIGLIHLLYPDPWPKRRHNKRRFVNQGSLREFHRILAPGGIFRFASDIDDYAGWTLAHIDRSGLFDWPARHARDWTEPYPGWPGTRYEAKAFREGRLPSYLEFIRR